MSSKTIIAAKEDTPEVTHELLDGLNRVSIQGVSMPENTLEFYTPLTDTLESIFGSSAKNQLIFNLNYLNSMSNKQVLKLIFSLSKKDPNISIIWKYGNQDELIKMKGEEIKNILSEVNISLESL
ncbi:MAG: SiaC family regulatory phosphoprotein [Bacteroidia bacterium]